MRYARGSQNQDLHGRLRAIDALVTCGTDYIGREKLGFIGYLL